MALFSMLRNASSSAVPLVIRAVGSSRVLDGAFSAVYGSGGLPSSILSHRFFSVMSDEERRAQALGEKIEKFEEKIKKYEEEFEKYDQKMMMATDKELLQAVEDEIRNAKKSDDDLDPERPAKFPFYIEDNPIEESIHLLRVYSDEFICIEVDMPHQTWPSRENSNVEDGDSDDDRDSDVVDEDSGDNRYSNRHRNYSNFRNDYSDGESENKEIEAVALPKINKEREAVWFPMTMSVTKGMGLKLECKFTTSVDDIVSIDSILLKEQTNEHPKSHIEYRLPDATQYFFSGFNASFYQFLKTRGVTPTTISFLYEYMVKKKQRERLPLLEGLEKFIKN